jgi:hypothetical protein
MRHPVILAVHLVFLPAVLAAQQPERFILTGDHIAIYNLAGAVTVEAGSGDPAVLLARGGADAGRLKIGQGESRGRTSLRVMYPSDRIVYRGLEGNSSTTLRVRPDGTFGDYDLRNHEEWEDEEGRRVRIAGSGDGLDAYADLRIQLPAGRRASLYLAVGKISVTNVDGDLAIDAHNAPVTATGTKGFLSIDVGSGPVTVSGASGELNVDTGSGTVEVTRFEGEELMVDTGSGEVTATEVKADVISIDTGSGDIRLTGAGAPRLTLETGSGNVTADVRANLEALDVETGSGNIAVTAPPGLGAEVEIETSSGDIETDFPVQVTRHSRDNLVGRIGNGRGRIAIETGSGNVRLLKRAS